MTDFVDAATRSRWMSGIKSTGTAPERFVRRALSAAGFRYRLHPASLPGRPDIAMQRWQVCIFVHGCFWHHHAGCRFARLPASRTEFWRQKFEQTAQRDARAIAALIGAGWRVIVVWECGIKDVAAPDLNWLPQAIRLGTAAYSEWPDPPPKRSAR